MSSTNKKFANEIVIKSVLGHKHIIASSGYNYSVGVANGALQVISTDGIEHDMFDLSDVGLTAACKRIEFLLNEQDGIYNETFGLGDLN